MTDNELIALATNIYRIESSMISFRAVAESDLPLLEHLDDHDCSIILEPPKTESGRRAVKGESQVPTLLPPDAQDLDALLYTNSP